MTDLGVLFCLVFDVSHDFEGLKWDGQNTAQHFMILTTIWLKEVSTITT